MLKSQCRLAFTRSYLRCRVLERRFFKAINVRSYCNSNAVAYDFSSASKGGIFSTNFSKGWKIGERYVFVSILFGNLFVVLFGNVVVV